LRHQIRKLLLCLLIRKIVRESVQVPPYLFVQAPGRYAVEPRQIGVEHHALTANDVDRLLNLLNRDGQIRPLLPGHWNLRDLPPAWPVPDLEVAICDFKSVTPYAV
jgi:hypothetical protein